MRVRGCGNEVEEECGGGDEMGGKGEGLLGDALGGRGRRGPEGVGR